MQKVKVSTYSDYEEINTLYECGGIEVEMTDNELEFAKMVEEQRIALHYIIERRIKNARSRT